MVAKSLKMIQFFKLFLIVSKGEYNKLFAIFLLVIKLRARLQVSEVRTLAGQWIFYYYKLTLQSRFTYLSTVHLFKTSQRVALLQVKPTTELWNEYLITL